MRRVSREEKKRGEDGCGEEQPDGAEAKDRDCNEGKDEGDSHLIDEGPECGVELRPVVVAEEEDVLKDKVGGDRRRPGQVDPVVLVESVI